MVINTLLKLYLTFEGKLSISLFYILSCRRVLLSFLATVDTEVMDADTDADTDTAAVTAIEK
jgi:hypothetical protein